MKEVEFGGHQAGLVMNALLLRTGSWVWPQCCHIRWLCGHQVKRVSFLWLLRFIPTTSWQKCLYLLTREVVITYILLFKHTNYVESCFYFLSWHSPFCMNFNILFPVNTCIFILLQLSSVYLKVKEFLSFYCTIFSLEFLMNLPFETFCYLISACCFFPSFYCISSAEGAVFTLS